MQAAVVVYVARTVPPRVNGDLAVAVALIALVDVLTAAGLPQMLAPRISAHPDARVPLARLIGFRLLLALPLFLLAQAVAAWLGGTSLAFFIRVTSVAWFAVVLDLDWFFVARGRVPLAAASRVLAALSRLVCVGALVRSSADASMLPVAWSLSVVFGAAGAWLLALTQGLLRSKPGAETLDLRTGRQSWEFLSGELAVYAFGQGDRLLLYVLGGAEATGLYHAAQRLVQPLLSVSAVVVATLYHDLAAAFGAARPAARPADSLALRAVLERYFRLMLYATLPLGAFVVLFAAPLTRWVYGPGYEAAAPVLALCGLVVTANYVAGTYVLPLKTWGLSSGYSRSVLSTLLVHFLASLALVPALGARGAALASLLSMVAATLVGRQAFRRAVSFAAGRAFLRPIGSTVLASAAAALAWRAGPVAAMGVFVAAYAAADLLAPWPKAAA